MKKMYLFAAAVALAASLTACGSKAPVDNAGTQAGEETTKQEASSTSSGDKKTVTFWAWDKEFNIAALEMAKEIYETDHPDVEINIVEVGQNDVVQKLNTGLGSGSLKGLPNAVPIEDYRIQSFLKSYPGAFMDLTSEINYDNFAAYKKGPMTLEGKSYGIPWDNGAAVLYYRKDMIEQAGYTEEDMQDLTWSKFIEMGKKIKEATGKKMISMDSSDIELMKLTMQSAGTWFTKEDGTTPDMENNAALRECLQIIKTITDDDLVRTYSGWAGLLEGVNKGEVAFQLKGCWFTPSIMKGEGQDGLWRVAKIPRLDSTPNATNASNLGGGSWYILNGVENSDIALDFLKTTFGENKELYNRLLDEKGIVGTYLPSQESEVYNKEIPFFGNQKIYQEIASITKEIPNVNYGTYTYAFQDIVMAEIQKILQGEDIDTAMKSMQVQAEAQAR
ncbi:ABC transporter substrate-binding protein [Hungatella effluvii]|uniref:ABC transporter substrate-binding protein n=1 Tax=Hungatella effluvii TaxID=1096246 RepID=UPI0022E857D1|nr:extracellular solute-binding protein [Hungatella effluvii]